MKKIPAHLQLNDRVIGFGHAFASDNRVEDPVQSADEGKRLAYSEMQCDEPFWRNNLYFILGGSNLFFQLGAAQARRSDDV